MSRPDGGERILEAAPPAEEVSDRRARPRPDGAVLSLAELEAVRLILRGGSVVDWYRLNFADEEEIRRFLSVLGGDLDHPTDRAHFERLRAAAVSYLTTEHGYRIPPSVLEAPPLDVFAFAAALKGRRRDRFYACLVLKVIHIVHHVWARELRYRLPLSNSELSQLLIRKVDGFVRALHDGGFPLASYSGGEKELSGTVTKLLVKKQHHAAAVRDRVRFRFVVEHAGDLVPLLHRMSSELLPFNYIVPGQTVNQLVNFTALIESHESYRKKAPEFQVEIGHEENSLSPLNEFSGPTYRVINFVADLPIRVPASVLSADDSLSELGPVIFGLAEFQVVDQDTARENESGENRHDRYKERQKQTVRERLERGLRGPTLDPDES